MRRVNINQPEFNLTQDQPGYSWRAAELGSAIGAARMGATLYELPPGEATFPYHYEYGCEEWLLLVSGSATLRDPDGDHALAAGDLVCFREGPEGGHRVVNTGDGPARMVILSTKSRPAVAVFPDSEKVLLFSGGEGDDLIARKADSVGYWDGES
jgi:uncharacterized cupin superfamily protein